MPELHGTLNQTQEGTRLSIDLAMHPFALAFLLVWMGGVALIALPMLVALAIGAASIPAALVPLGMLAVGIALAKFGFGTEADRATEELRDLLDAEISTEPADS